MSLAVLLAQYNEVLVLDIDPQRVEKINEGISTISDSEIEDFLRKKNLTLSATLNKNLAYSEANFVIIATPTNYEPISNSFDTSSVDSAVKDALEHNKNAYVVIKSTIPVGHTCFLQQKFSSNRIIFSPEFLREGNALKDNLYPSRIIIGSLTKAGKIFANLLVQGAKKKHIDTLFIPSTEAEAIKLFANTYLAMRVSFFNELDSYALSNNLDTKSIIEGVCFDDRIGSGYNNPSFGYGGYCLPKDTKQLLANYQKVPQKLIQAIVSSNSTRKDFLSDIILQTNPKVIGIFKLIMKHGSDNFRASAIQGIIRRVKQRNIQVVIYEPILSESEFLGSKVIKTLDDFKLVSDIIISNRISNDLTDVKDKVFTRDIYGID